MPYKDKEDLKSYQKEWLRKRRERFYKGKKCKGCGTTKNLSLHHREPGKKVDHRIWSWAPDRFLREIKKCDVYCKKCHDAMPDSEAEKRKKKRNKE